MAEGIEIQFKEGCFTFPANFKCRVDVPALEKIPREFEICRQGIEALGHLFYQVQMEQKEGVTIQKAIWENMLERILPIGVFNATSTYTNLANQILPVRVSLPHNRQHFPIDSVLSKEPTNPFLETKKFARELLDIVAAIKTLREEELFGYREFHLYPARHSFVLTESQSGDRYLAAGLYLLAPAETEEAPSEKPTVRAIHEIVQERWDRREFRKVLKANTLNDIFAALKHLSRDIPPLEAIARKAACVAMYGFAAFLIFSVLMFLSGLTFNRPQLDRLSLKVASESGWETIATDADNPRIVMNVGETNSEDLQIIGRYLAPYRLESLGMGILDSLYRLNYEAPLPAAGTKTSKIRIGKFATRDMLKGTLFVKEDLEGKDESFRLKGMNQWGRQRFRIFPRTPGVEEDSEEGFEEEGPSIGVEALVVQKEAKLSTSPQEIVFQRAEGAVDFIEKDLKVFTAANREPDTALAYFNVSFPTAMNQDPPPVTIRYLQGTTPVAEIVFQRYVPGENPKIQTAEAPKTEILYEEDEQTGQDDRKRTGKKTAKKRRVQESEDDEKLVDAFRLNNQVFYHLPRIPAGMAITNVQVAVPSDRLPKEDVTGTLHMAIPGIIEPKSISIVFRPEQKIQFLQVKSQNSSLTAVADEEGKVKEGEYSFSHIRYEVTGFAYPLFLQKGMWTQWSMLDPSQFAQYDFEVNYSGPDPEGISGLSLGLRLNTDPDTVYFFDPDQKITRAMSEFTGSEGMDLVSAPRASQDAKEADLKESAQMRGRIKYFNLAKSRTLADEYFQFDKDAPKDRKSVV